MKINQLLTIVKLGITALAVLGLGWAGAVRADEKVSAPVSLPVHLTGKLAVSDCENAPGPQVTLDGNLVLGGLNVQVIFRNNVKGTHEHIETYSTNAVVLPEGGTLVVPKQPVLGGAGGNPFIWFQLIDENGNALSDEIYLGRCVQGLAAVDVSVFNAGIANATIGMSGCANNPGPFITVTGGITLAGLKGRFIFRNNDNPVDGPHEAVRVADISLLANGTEIKFPKQPVLGGVGGNPWIWLQFLYPNGEPASDEILIGRCVQSSK